MISNSPFNPSLKEKYRPKNISDMVDMRGVKLIINNLIKRNSFNPILIYGPNGNGKSTLASLLFKLIFCEYRNGLESCGDCEFCINSGGFDYFKIYGVELNMKRLRSITDHLVTAHFTTSRSLFIDDIDMAHGKLLRGIPPLLDKFSVEPIIFTATRLDLLPSPLIQRCNCIPLYYDTDSLMPWVESICAKERIDIESPKMISKMIAMADFNPRNLLNTIDRLIVLGLDLSSEVLMNPLVIACMGTHSGNERIIYS